MTEKENLALALDGKMPAWTPCFWNGAQIIVSHFVGHCPPPGVTAGLDGFGVHQTSTENTGGMYTPTATVPPVLTDITKWREQVTFPDIESLDWEKCYEIDAKMIGGVHRDQKLLDYYHGNGLFERLHFLMGMEGAMLAIMEEPEAVSEFVGALADHHIAVAKQIEKYYKPDYYTFLDDYSHLRGLFMSPATFDEIFAPHLKRIVDFVNGSSMKFKMHCCGKFEDLLDHFYALGIRRFDPCQPCNDLKAIREKYPDIALMGGLDLQGCVDLEGATEEQIRGEVRRCIDEYGPLGGYTIFGASVSMYDGRAYAPGGKMFTICSEAGSYAHQK